VGKWHLGSLPDFSPLKSGYDHFLGIIASAADYFNHGPSALRDLAFGFPGVYGQLHEQEVPVERHGYLTNLLGDRAVQTIEGYARSREPFLLSLHFTAPHWPWEGPDDEAESRRIKDILHRDGGSRRTYAAMVQSLDANVGRVLQALDASGLAGNTIVVFTSDNGGKRFSDTWPFSGMKEELLEGGLRVPSIIRWPGRIAARSVSEQVMATMDWMPTLLAAAGTAPDAAHPPDGEDLGPVVADRAAPHPRKLYWRYHSGSQRAVRDGNWKYLRIADNEFLFDVVADPREGQSQGKGERCVRSAERRLGSLELNHVARAAAADVVRQSWPRCCRSLRRGEPSAPSPTSRSADEMIIGRDVRTRYRVRPPRQIAETVMAIKTLSFIAFMAAIAPAVCAADADKAWPERKVRIITTPPGSSPDGVARALADVFAKRWNRPVIVENRSSGADMVLLARGFLEAKDGHTLLLAPHSLLTVNPVLHGTLPYDPERDFAPISLVVEDFLCVAVAIARRQLARRAGETSSHQAG
jgi:hypothetical protein